MKRLTQKKLRKLLHYSKKSGLFTWEVSRGRVKMGQIAGTLRSSGYIQIKISGKYYYAQRLAFLYVKGKWPKNQADHKNRIKDDNRWKNLREATHSQNQHNKSKRKDNTSGITGVSFSGLYWVATIIVRKKHFYLGCFKKKDKAISARKNAEKKLVKYVKN